MSTVYRNPWHNPVDWTCGPRLYETNASPTEYRGLLIYERRPGVVWDVVRRATATEPAVLLAQSAGLAAAQRAIDRLKAGDEPEDLQDD